MIEFTQEELANEMWRPVDGTEGLYDVSSLGRVRSWATTGTSHRRKDEPRLLSRIRQKQTGYYSVTIYYPDGTHPIKMVHRLVACAFIPNPDDLPCINHKDESRTNNRVENLEWCTYKYNANYGTCVDRIKSKQGKAVVCVDTGETWPSVNECAKLTGLDTASVSQCCNGRSSSCCGMRFRFVSDCKSDNTGNMANLSSKEDPEEWRTIPGFPVCYEVSDLGRVRRICKYKHGAVEAKLLKQSISRAGFYMVKMQLPGHKECILKSVHRLVGLAFLPTDDTSLLLNHINGIKTDNRAVNMTWCVKHTSSKTINAGAGADFTYGELQ